MGGGKNLYPVFQMPEFKQKTESYDKKYKRSMKWDPEKGDFVRDGANRVMDCSGTEAYQIWCCKTARTERFRCLAYPGEIGVEMEEALKEPDEKAVESAVERTVQEALQTNPRTEYVRGFTFSWQGDALSVSCIVKGIHSPEFELSI